MPGCWYYCFWNCLLVMFWDWPRLISGFLASYAGSCQADPRLRARGAADVQTLWWRAPEVLFGSRGFGRPIDVWSLGLVLAEMAGCRFQAATQEKTCNEVGYRTALFQQLGTPADAELRGLPNWPGQAPQFSPRPWPAATAALLGPCGVELLDATLAWAPAQRPTAAEVNHSAFARPELFAARPAPAGRGFGEAFYQGARHPWNICVGAFAAEVLAWLRADPALQPGSPEFAALAVDFGAKRSDAKSEEGRKFILAGALGQCGSGEMCGLSLSRPLPLARVQAWRAAFLEANAAAFAALDASAKTAVRRLRAEDRGKNGQHFLDSSFAEWFCSCGELVFVEPGGEEAGFWAEPEHQDGGASVMHLGLTLFGRRTLACRQGLGLPDVTVANGPGTVYVGQLTGPVHQVTHEAALRSDDLLEVPGLGRLGVNIMMRTALFPFNRARMRNTTPSPPAVFEALNRCFRESFAAHALRLPTRAECEAQDVS